MSTKVINGYLVIADISGFTSYVAQTELEHANGVLTELLELVVKQFEPTLSMVKLEGDAVFAHGDEEVVFREDRVPDIIEATYVEFRDRVAGIVKNTTCQCNACIRIPMLDLKFFVHYGQYMMQKINRIDDLVGSDVNLLHHLTKNSITDRFGWRGYVMYTDAALNSMGLASEGMEPVTETYEHLGDIQTFNANLRDKYKEYKENRIVFVTAEEAMSKGRIEIDAPPQIVWEWLSTSDLRNTFTSKFGAYYKTVTKLFGRIGVGTTNHCAHGAGVMVETIVDWKPYKYHTTKAQDNVNGVLGPEIYTTSIFEPLDDGKRTLYLRHERLVESQGRLQDMAWKQMSQGGMKAVLPMVKEVIENAMKKSNGVPTLELLKVEPAVGGAEHRFEEAE